MPREVDPVFVKMDELSSMSRLQDVAFLLGADRSARIERMLRVCSRLDPGAYLLGFGPSNGGVLPLTVDEVVLGRLPTPGEQVPASVVDYAVNDSIWLGPREVSRVHARIVRMTEGKTVRHRLEDLQSTTGTFLNGRALTAGGEGEILTHGDVISLGPSRVTSFVFFVVPR
jgi:hypothetical protein